MTRRRMRLWVWACAALAWAGVGGCYGTRAIETPTTAKQIESGRQGDPPDRRLTGQDGARQRSNPTAAESESLRTIAPGEIVPSFVVHADDGHTFDSDPLIGKRPFLLVFFASWCPVCHEKIPLVQRVLDEHGDGWTVIGVALDEVESWQNVEHFVKRYRLTFRIVRGEQYPRFVASYDPFGAVPLVISVDTDGRIVDLQMGMGADHRARLATFLTSRAAQAAAKPDHPAL